MAFLTEELAPDRDLVLEDQGLPGGKAASRQIEALCSTAFDLLFETAAPAGIICDISSSDFEVVYQGEGLNEPRTPVGDIFGRADRLALFAVTLGQRISQEIQKRFEANDFALGCMLDSVASAAADKTAEIAERRFLERLTRNGRAGNDIGVLRYSPGYCGWHLSGQRRLFEFLHPERIAISLKDSFLMEPLKSVSGVMIGGRKEIHGFEDSYSFCGRCDTHGCRERIRALLGE